MLFQVETENLQTADNVKRSYSTCREGMDVPKIMYYRIGPTRNKTDTSFVMLGVLKVYMHGSCFTCQGTLWGSAKKRQGGKAKGDFKFSLVWTQEPEAMQSIIKIGAIRRTYNEDDGKGKMKRTCIGCLKVGKNHQS